jgi:hypothetical protein
MDAKLVCQTAGVALSFREVEVHKHNFVSFFLKLSRSAAMSYKREENVVFIWHTFLEIGKNTRSAN